MRSLTKSLGGSNGLLSRRRFLGLLASASASAACPPMFAASQAIFEVNSPPETGITWGHNNARSQTRFMPETIGPGCAFLDYDNDGWMDIYLVNSGPSDFYDPRGQVRRNALYRNNRDGTFTDVTSKAGVAGGNFGMGVAVGDYDSDGFPDMYVTGYGRNILYHNNG